MSVGSESSLHWVSLAIAFISVAESDTSLPVEDQSRRVTLVHPKESKHIIFVLFDTLLCI